MRVRRALLRLSKVCTVLLLASWLLAAGLHDLFDWAHHHADSADEPTIMLCQAWGPDNPTAVPVVTIAPLVLLFSFEFPVIFPEDPGPVRRPPRSSAALPRAPTLNPSGLRAPPTAA